MKLYYFTDSYPFGIGEQWKANELGVLKDHFDVTVIPYSHRDNFNNPKPLPGSVRLAGPLFDSEPFRWVHLLNVLFHRKVGKFLGEFFGKKVFLSRAKMGSWLQASKRVINLLKHPVIKDVIKGDNKNSVLYFYWGRGSCEILPFIKTEKFHKSFVRMHGYDLFEYRNNGYIPYRKQLLKSASIIAPSSQAGKNHLDSLYPGHTSNVKVVRCGTLSNGKYTREAEGPVFRIASCAMLLSLKRVHLQIEALQYLGFPVEWYHIGDGQLRKDLEDLATQLKVNDKFHFVGLLDSRQVLDFYTNHSFDLFVNVSEYEGVPFSIMEAYSVGIPVMATDVGGSGEIVNDQLGKLIEKDIDGRKLAAHLETFYKKPTAEKKELRERVIAEYEKKWNAITLTKQLAIELKSGLSDN